LFPFALSPVHPQAINGKPGYYVQSTTPETPRLPYKAVHKMSETCFRSHTSIPSIDSFSQMVSQAKCFHPDMVTLNF
jgi:hypothetical protein